MYSLAAVVESRYGKWRANSCQIQPSIVAPENLPIDCYVLYHLSLGCDIMWIFVDQCGYGEGKVSFGYPVTTDTCIMNVLYKRLVISNSAVPSLLQLTASAYCNWPISYSACSCWLPPDVTLTQKSCDTGFRQIIEVWDISPAQIMHAAALILLSHVIHHRQHAWRGLYSIIICTSSFAISTQHQSDLNNTKTSLQTLTKFT